MTWQDLGSLGEVVSALAVVISLVYLAFQIRQNTRQIDQNTNAVRASAMDSSIGHAMAVRQSVSEKPELAHLFLAGSRDPTSLTEEELLRYRLLLHNVLWSIWNIYSQARFAGLSSGTWASQVHLLSRVVSTPGGRWFWDQYGHEFEEPFQAEVQRILDSPKLASPGDSPAA